MKKALLVGINKYKIPGCDLNGCVNDVTNLRDILLKYFGFEVSDIRVLTDERATKKSILDGLSYLTKSAKKDDILVFQFSGHGSQIVDKNGDELKDNLDEILCPYDMDWEGTYIVDDELNNLFGSVDNQVNVEIILDSCHSGTGTRELAGLKLLPKEETFLVKYLYPPTDIECRMDYDMPRRSLFSRVKEQIGTNFALFTACKDNQVAADSYIDGSYNGVFSYYLCKYLRENSGNITRSELLKRVRYSLKYHGFAQTPQLECSAAKKKKKFLD